MFETIKARFKKKPIVLCIHGFGRRKSSEYNNFKLWGSKQFKFVTFDIFDDSDDSDTDANTWIKRCEEQVEALLPNDIYLIGFSMGGVLASHLASKYPIKKLFLIAPAFEFVSVKAVIDTLIKRFTTSTSQISMSSKQTSCFIEVVNLCKADINTVTCPVCLVHGDQDEVIPIRSSINAYNKIPHDNKRLFILHEGVHRLMLDTKTNNETYQIFKLFMEDKIVTYFPMQAADPYGELEKEDIKKA